MDRVISNVGESIYEWMFTKPDQNKMTALGKMAAVLFGTATLANGLACVPTGPASMQVVINPGEIYSLANLEASVCGTLPQDTTHQIVKQGILLDALTTTAGALAAPGTAGQSVNYLIEVQYADLDVSIDPTTGTTPVVLQFYNASNPTQPWSGPNNSGQTSTTFRKGVVSLQVKAGTAAATGSQTTPAPDAGWVGLWVVTVANGQSTITAGNITQYAGAPILPSSLLSSIQTGNLSYAVGTGTANAHVVALTPVLTQRIDGMVIRYKAPAANTGALTLNDGLGAVSVVGGAHAALQGGETAVNGDVWVQWNTSIGGGSYVLLDSTGGALQVAPAVVGNHAAQLSQVGFSNIAVYRRIAGVQQVSINGAAYTTTGATTFPQPISGRAKARVWAAGGGNGGSSGSGAYGGAGGGGGYSEGIVTGLSGATAVTVGAGGTAGAATPTAGGNGGSSSFGSFFTATGGGGGNPQAGAGSASGGPAGSGSGSLAGLAILGSGGGSGVNAINMIGSGGSSFGTPSLPTIVVGASSTGVAGFAPGGGASGTLNSAGTAGADGLVIVEY